MAMKHLRDFLRRRIISEKEVSEVMDIITDIYEQIKDTKKRLDTLYDSAGEICNLIKCLPESKNVIEVQDDKD